MQVEVDILDSQAQAFHQAQAGAVEQLGLQLIGAGEGVEQAADFVSGEHGGKSVGAPGAHGVERELDLLEENLAVEEEQGAEGLVLGGGGDVLVDGQVGEEGFDLEAAHGSGVALVVEEDEAADPAQVGAFGA